MSDEESKYVTDIKEISSDINYYVEIKCNKCGKVYCMFPNRVMLPPTCECGNKDSGDWREWALGKFGDFELVKASICILSVKSPFGDMKLN